MSDIENLYSRKESLYQERKEQYRQQNSLNRDINRINGQISRFEGFIEEADASKPWGRRQIESLENKIAGCNSAIQEAEIGLEIVENRIEQLTCEIGKVKEEIGEAKEERREERQEEWESERQYRNRRSGGMPRGWSHGSSEPYGRAVNSFVMNCALRILVLYRYPFFVPKAKRILHIS